MNNKWLIFLSWPRILENQCLQYVEIAFLTVLLADKQVKAAFSGDFLTQPLIVSFLKTIANWY